MLTSNNFTVLYPGTLLRPRGLLFKHQHPRVTYIAYGGTDDFAHDGSYDRYIDAANPKVLLPGAGEAMHEIFK